MKRYYCTLTFFYVNHVYSVTSILKLTTSITKCIPVYKLCSDELDRYQKRKKNLLTPLYV